MRRNVSREFCLAERLIAIKEARDIGPKGMVSYILGDLSSCTQIGLDHGEYIRSLILLDRELIWNVGYALKWIEDENVKTEVKDMLDKLSVLL